MTLTRRQAREWAVQMLTAADLNPPEDIDAFIAQQWEQLGTLEDAEGGIDSRPSTKLREFTEARVRGVLEGRTKVDELLAPCLKNWDLDRLGTVERVVLRLGIWEMTFSDVPPPVVINECVDLANWFSSPKTRALVNGVLDGYAKSLKS